MLSNLKIKIGIVGYNTRSGIGVQNRQLYHYLPNTFWYQTKHPSFVSLDTPKPTHQDLHTLVQDCDLILMIERPLNKLVEKALPNITKPIVCIINQEWMPKKLQGWPSCIRKFICPTYDCFLQFKDKLPCLYFPWPVDTENFPFLQRQQCQKFIFIDGHGGYRGRKGADVVIQAKQIWPEMPLTVFTQRKITWPDNIEVRSEVADAKELYSSGDVLIAPHKIDGLGLEFLEAASSGMPVISTNGAPWNEFPAIARIPATQRKIQILRTVTWYEPKAEALATICKSIYNTDLQKHSKNARAWAEARSWSKLWKKFYDLLAAVVTSK